jgi:hypothetical protein
MKEYIDGADIRTDISTIPAARKFLSTNGLILSTGGGTLENLSLAIFELSLSSSLGATHTEALRAIAMIAHEIEQTINTNRLVDKITALMGGPIATLDEKVEALSEFTEKQTAALDKAMNEVRDHITVSSKGIEKAVEGAIQAKHTETLPNQSKGPISYASVTKTGMPAPLTRILSRSEAQAKQILISKRFITGINTLRDLTEAQLVAKAGMAIELLKNTGADLPVNMAIISARKLTHGGILYELNNQESAAWLNTPGNRSSFLEHFGAEVIIKDRSYQLIIENVPISFNPSSPMAIAEIETKGGLQQKSVIKARYIKPVARRTPNQRTAHIALSLSTKTSANQIIRHGITIEGKKVYGRKLLPEPTRCLKCHTFDGGHLASECQQEHDTCGTCGEQHRTAECKVIEQTTFHCVNCKADGHAAWSRECPTFKAKWEAHKKRNDEAQYIYFPTEDPTTWETNKYTQGQLEPEPDQDRQQQHQTQEQPLPPIHEEDWTAAPPCRPNNKVKQQRTTSNRIPLGTQSRLTDTWGNGSQQTSSQQRDPQHAQNRSRQPSLTDAPPLAQRYPLFDSDNDLTGWE